MTSKKDIVTIMKNFLINFDHKELGKSLDSKNVMNKEIISFIKNKYKSEDYIRLT